MQLPEFGGVRPTLVPVGVDQDPHIRLSRDIAQAHRLYNVTLTKDNRIGVFVKVDGEVSKLLDQAENILKNIGFSKCERITKYKALYINDASKKDIPLINKMFATEESTLGGYGFLQPCSTYHRFITGLTGDKMSSSKPESAIFLTDTPSDAQKKIIQAKTGGAVTLAEQRKQGGSPDTCVIYELFLYHLIEEDAELGKIYQSCKAGELMCGQCKKRAATLMEELLIDIAEKRKTVKEQLDIFIKED